MEHMTEVRGEAVHVCARILLKYTINIDEVNKRSARDGRLQSTGPSNFQRAAKTQHSQNEFNVTKNK